MHSLFHQWMLNWVVMPTLFLSHNCQTEQHGPLNSVLGLKEKSALLKCQQTALIGRAPVMWLHPHTGMAISVNDKVMLPELATRMVIVGNNAKGQFDLLIKYVRYPDDAGVWKCVSLGMKQTRNLTVIVPPVEKIPNVYPSQVDNINHEAWTFSCTALYAIPPVKLKWVKVTGPDVDYDVTLPTYVMSAEHSVAVTLRIIVSPLNFGSIFKCVAEHPSFDNSIAESKVIYSPPMPLLLKAAGIDEENSVPSDAVEQAMKKLKPQLALGLHEKVSILLLVMILLVFVIVAILLYRKRRKWQWNDISLPGNTAGNRTRRCKFGVKATVWVVCSVVLTACLSLSIPVYMKGITIPLLGTDMLMSVSAGSALWMDCGSKIQPINSLLQITWHYNFQPFFRQYMVNGNNIGFPNNSTMGFMKGVRTKSYRIGQISIWPILPGEDGVYSCEVAGLEDNTGKTRIKRKTFGVFVVTGPYLNKPLLLLLSLALAASVVVFLTVSCHIVVRRKQNKNSSLSHNVSREFTPTANDDV